MAFHVWEAFHWSKLDENIPPPPPNPLTTYFQQLCPNFIKEDADEEAEERTIQAIVQVTFYAMTAAHTKELGVLTGIVVNIIEEALQDLKWCSFEGWLAIHMVESLSASQRVLTGKAAVALGPDPSSEEIVGLNSPSQASEGNCSSPCK